MMYERMKMYHVMKRRIIGKLWVADRPVTRSRATCLPLRKQVLTGLALTNVASSCMTIQTTTFHSTVLPSVPKRGKGKVSIEHHVGLGLILAPHRYISIISNLQSSTKYPNIELSAQTQPIKSSFEG